MHLCFFCWDIIIYMVYVKHWVFITLFFVIICRCCSFLKCRGSYIVWHCSISCSSISVDSALHTSNDKILRSHDYCWPPRCNGVFGCLQLRPSIHTLFHPQCLSFHPCTDIVREPFDYALYEPTMTTVLKKRKYSSECSFYSVVIAWCYKSCCRNQTNNQMKSMKHTNYRTGLGSNPQLSTKTWDMSLVISYKTIYLFIQFFNETFYWLQQSYVWGTSPHINDWLNLPCIIIRREAHLKLVSLTITKNKIETK